MGMHSVLSLQTRVAHLVHSGRPKLGGHVLASERRAVATVVALHDIREDYRPTGLEDALHLVEKRVVVHAVAEGLLAPHDVVGVGPLDGKGVVEGPLVAADQLPHALHRAAHAVDNNKHSVDTSC